LRSLRDSHPNHARRRDTDSESTMAYAGQLVSVLLGCSPGLGSTALDLTVRVTVPLSPLIAVTGPTTAVGSRRAAQLVVYVYFEAEPILPRSCPGTVILCHAGRIIVRFRALTPIGFPVPAPTAAPVQVERITEVGPPQPLGQRIGPGTPPDARGWSADTNRADGAQALQYVTCGPASHAHAWSSVSHKIHSRAKLLKATITERTLHE
jgi:hypothetical protein